MKAYANLHGTILSIDITLRKLKKLFTRYNSMSQEKQGSCRKHLHVRSGSNFIDSTTSSVISAGSSTTVKRKKVDFYTRDFDERCLK